MGFKRDLCRFFPTEILMGAPVTYPIGVKQGKLKKWTQHLFEREGSGGGQVDGSPGWGTSFAPAPPPDPNGSTPSCLPLGAKDGWGPGFRLQGPHPSLIIQDGGGPSGRHAMHIHEGRGLPPAGAPGRVLKSSLEATGAPGRRDRRRRSRSAPDLSLFPAGKS